MDDAVLPLDSGDATLQVAGGKGANLSILAQAGFNVPPGFLITTQAYDSFVEEDGIRRQIEDLIATSSADDHTSLESTAHSIRDLFVQGTIPEQLALAIGTAYKELSASAVDGAVPDNDLAVAVRSSATTEDLPTASFAGQQETYLNVRGLAGLLEAVKSCWASLWTARAMAYRARLGIEPSTVSLAVIVQRMAPAEVAGILFTANPLTGDSTETVINASWGLGEAIVTGRVSPDNIIMDKETGSIKEISVGDKATMTAAAASGTAEVPVDPQLRQRASLTPEQASELNRLGRKIESVFKGPQDIEWAIAGGRVFVLQSRPVTVHPSPASGKPLEELVAPGDDDWPLSGESANQEYQTFPFDLWTQFDVGERWPEPVTPLTWSSVPLSIDENRRYSLRDLKADYLAKIRWAKRAYGRVYFNEGATVYVFVKEYGMPGSLLAATFDGQAQDSPWLRARLRPLKVLRMMPLLSRQSKQRKQNQRNFERLFPTIDGWVKEFMRRDLGTSSDVELWKELNEVWMRRVIDVINLHTDVTADALIALPTLRWFLRRFFGRDDLAQDLVTGISGVIGAEIAPGLYALAEHISDLGLASLVLDLGPDAALAELRRRPEARTFIEMLDQFLERHGHRCANEAEFLYPRWAEAPEPVISSLAGYLRAGDSINPKESEAKQRQKREQAIAWAEGHLDPIRRRFFRSQLVNTEYLVRLRDNGQNYAVKTLLPVRRILGCLAKRWTTRGWLRQEGDLFFLALQEIGKIIASGDPNALGRDLPEIVAARRQAYEFWRSARAPEAIGPDGRPFVQATMPESGDFLVGVVGSTGQARGVARIIHDPSEASRLKPGDILVTRSTDPGWTPLFPIVGGLVLEVGGPLSHGAIVAREYGLPAILNVTDATRRIRDGQVVTIDGSTGRVYLLS